MGAWDLAHGLMTATGELGFSCFDSGSLGCGRAETGKSIVQPPHHHKGGDDGEGALELMKAESGKPFAKTGKGVLGDPKKWDGAHAKGEGKFSAPKSASAEQGGGKEEVERTAGKKGSGETHDKSAAPGGEFEGTHAGPGDDAINELWAG